LLAKPTLDPPEGAAALSVTVQFELPGPVTLAGVHDNPVTVTAGAVTLSATVFEELPRVAVRVAVRELVTAATVAVKVPVAAPAATDTLAGTVTLALLLASPTLRPPEGAAELRVTVQFEVPGAVTLAGAHDNPVTVTVTAGATTLRENVCEEPPKVAVRVAVWELVTAATVAVKVTLVAPAGTVTLAGWNAMMMVSESALAAGIV
jgi:hypothetical protein